MVCLRSFGGGVVGKQSGFLIISGGGGVLSDGDCDLSCVSGLDERGGRDCVRDDHDHVNDGGGVRGDGFHGHDDDARDRGHARDHGDDDLVHPPPLLHDDDVLHIHMYKPHLSPEPKVQKYLVY